MSRDDSILYELIGIRIRKLRKAQRLTQAALANRVGVHRVTIAHAERGAVKLTLSNLYAVARELNVKIGALLPER